jgi:thiol-disulfide isomerase/thioredoxin
MTTPILLTEDDEGGWTRTFGPTRVPAVYLVNARREFVWHAEGELDATTLAQALDKHLVAAPATRPRSLGLAITSGQRAPDVFFRDGADEFALHRLKGRTVLLNFWQAWSAPCLKELQRLQALQTAARESLSIVAFHGGNDATCIDRIRKELGLSIVLAHDAEQRIARRYGVRCWPTTVTIDEAGIVRGIQFGISSHDSSHAADVAQLSAT